MLVAVGFWYISIVQKWSPTFFKFLHINKLSQGSCIHHISVNLFWCQSSIIHSIFNNSQKLRNLNSALYKINSCSSTKQDPYTIIYLHSSINYREESLSLLPSSFPWTNSYCPPSSTATSTTCSSAPTTPCVHWVSWTSSPARADFTYSFVFQSFQQFSLCLLRKK